MQNLKKFHNLYSLRIGAKNCRHWFRILPPPVNAEDVALFEMIYSNIRWYGRKIRKLKNTT